MEQIDIKSLTLPELEEQLLLMGEKKFRAKQIYEWMHVKLARDFSEMSNISKQLQEKCKEHFSYTSLRAVQVQTS